MTDPEALRLALDYLGKREQILAATFDAGIAPNERIEAEYQRITEAMQRIEAMLRKPRQRGFER